MTMTLAQLSVVESNATHILCSSGPGSGKSRVLIERIKRLVRDGVNPSRIVAISYTCAASAVLQERLGDVKLGCNSTLHAWLLSLLTTHGHLIGLPATISVIDEDEQRAILDDVLAETAYRGAVKAVASEVAKGLQGRLNPMTKEQIAAEAFFQKLRSEGILTYDMILHAGERLLKAMAAKGLTLGVEHLLVDEAADLTEQDWRIIEAAGVPNVWCCGDFDQAVYAWRSGEKVNGFEERCKMRSR